MAVKFQPVRTSDVNVSSEGKWSQVKVQPQKTLFRFRNKVINFCQDIWGCLPLRMIQSDEAKLTIWAPRELNWCVDSPGYGTILAHQSRVTVGILLGFSLTVGGERVSQMSFLGISARTHAVIPPPPPVPHPASLTPSPSGAKRGGITGVRIGTTTSAAAAAAAVDTISPARF